MGNKVAAVIVTFNRKQLLKECIESLQSQSYPLSAIIIVNNGSTDGTKEWLDTQSNLIIFHQENVGGAGGFHRGMKEAYDLGYDWIWIMDDDVEPKLDCLEVMSRYFNKFKLLVPTKLVEKTNEFVDPSNLTYNLSSIFKKRNTTVRDEYPTYDVLPEELCISDMSFEGPIFSREVITTIGLPNKNYFILGDDAEYGIRFRLQMKENIYLLKKAIFFKKMVAAHQFGDAKAISMPYWKLYYSIRNLTKIYLTHGQNLLMKIYPLMLLTKHLIYAIKNKNFKYLKIAWQATFDGYGNKMENRYLPSSKI